MIKNNLIVEKIHFLFTYLKKTACVFYTLTLEYTGKYKSYTLDHCGTRCRALGQRHG